MGLNRLNFIDVSHGIGVPFGGLGTGYGVLGRNGFVLPNFDSCPNQGKYSDTTAPESYDYLKLHGKDRNNFMSLVINIDGKEYLFCKEIFGKKSGIPADSFQSYELLPFGLHIAEYNAAGITVEMLAYSPMIPYELSESSIPAFCMEVNVKNTGSRAVQCSMEFQLETDDERIMAAWINGHSATSFTLKSGESKNAGGILTWFYPLFRTPSEVLTEEYKRYYTLKFSSCKDVFDYAVKNYKLWKSKMERWQNSLKFPQPLLRLWFSSLSSVITSTMLSTEPYFFEIESPHPYINTMDVTIYSSWIYMINWPELELMDMKQYGKCIACEGKDKGFVWHSLWADRADYVEEPCFIARMYRDYLWYGEREFLLHMRKHIENAINRILQHCEYEGLVESKHGNQSYDLWKMPGISAYVNVTWLYALYSIIQMKKTADINICVTDGRKVEEILEQAKENFRKYLWNTEFGYVNCFKRTEGSSECSDPESVFTDQMFGRWLLLIERGNSNVLPDEMIRASIDYVYENNLIDDSENEFRGWANGMLRNAGVYYDSKQYHAMTCWIGAQLNLASMLAYLGEENKSLDVIFSIEKSLKNNHLAVGEWNRSVTVDGKSAVLPQEPSKDTPRFPAYPRYKSCWEYLVQIIGLRVDSEYMELSPFKSMDFSIDNIILAGCRLNISVKKSWQSVSVDGNLVKRAVFKRGESHVIVFE